MSALNSSLILSAVMPVGALLLVGFAMRKHGVVEEGLRTGLVTLVTRLLFPALVLAKVTRNTALQDNAVAFLAPAAGFASLALGYAVSYTFAGLCNADTSERRRTFAYTTGSYNSGYLAIPLCAALYGPESVAILLLFNVGHELCMWTTGTALLTGGMGKAAWKRILNPMTIAMILAMTLNRTGVAPHLPDWFFRTTDMLGACAVPCGLMLIGMGIPALLNGFVPHRDKRISAGAVLLRNGLIPAIFVVAGVFLPLPTEVSRVLILQAAMPAALFPIVMCQHYNIAPQVSLRVAVATTLGSIGTLPAWLWLGPWCQTHLR